MKLNLENQIYQAKCLKCYEPNIPNQIYSIKHTKLNQTNQFYQTKYRETKSTENKTNPSLLCNLFTKGGGGLKLSYVEVDQLPHQLELNKSHVALLCRCRIINQSC